MRKILSEESKRLLRDSNKIYLEILGYIPEQTSLIEIPKSEWNKYLLQRKMKNNSSGVYLPRDQTAIIIKDNPLSLFHEYFGHGLYCEKNLIGKKLVDLEKKLLEEERKNFCKSKFNLDDLKNFRKRNPKFQELKEFNRKNTYNYELFAIWTEYFLSKEHNLLQEFEKKYDSISKKEKDNIDSIISFSSKYGSLATMYAQGMARKTTPQRVKRLLEEIYKENLKDAIFCLLYGSKKEYSDIDVFIVGSNLNKICNNWLDISIYDLSHFEYCLSMFDVSVTDPLFSGETIFPKNKNLLLSYKNKLKTQKISNESLYYNLVKSKEQFLLSLYYPENSREKKIGEQYSKTYFANYLALKNGIRLFTKNELLSYLQKQAPAEGDKPLQLKGGKI